MLDKSTKFDGIKGPVVIVVMDGVGINQTEQGNAVAQARTPILDSLAANSPSIAIRAHGTAVGMPSDADMGNSEVGHNAIGSGQVYSQGAKLVAHAIADQSIFAGHAWKEVSENAKKSTLHLLGLFSDGNVHSHIDHLKALIEQAKVDGVPRVRIHALIDGRDVPETSALDYTVPFEEWIASLCDDNFDVCIASGGGRQNITMDRYDANWPLVEKGWMVHVLGQGPQFPSATEAIQELRMQNPGTIDQDLPPFVIAKEGEPVGTIEDGDSVVFFNFRGDRAIEITRAFVEEDFSEFERVRYPRVTYAGMLQYDGDLKLPERFLVEPPSIKDTLGEHLVESGIKSFACSETQKYGHVTYFWNGNRSNKFSEKLETFVEVPSDVIPFEQRPWMKAAEITDELIKAIESNEYQFLRINLANGDMVGHTGHLEAAVIGVEVVDLSLERILKAVQKAQGVCLVTADHGNADEMFELDKKTNEPKKKPDGSYKAKTSHTLNLVPFHMYNATDVNLNLKNNTYGLSNIAATVAELLGLVPHRKWDESMLDR